MKKTSNRLHSLFAALAALVLAAALAVPALPLVSRQPNRAHRLSVSRRRALPAAQRAASRVCSP